MRNSSVLGSSSLEDAELGATGYPYPYCVANDSSVLAFRGERVLAFMVAAAIGLSIICFLAVIIGTGVGVTDFGTGIWPVVIVLPVIGLPLGLLLMITLLIVSGIRRAREARDASS
jgi:magnesium-transporting ATPase (P-type)